MQASPWEVLWDLIFLVIWLVLLIKIGTKSSRLDEQIAFNELSNAYADLDIPIMMSQFRRFHYKIPAEFIPDEIKEVIKKRGYKMSDKYLLVSASEAWELYRMLIDHYELHN